MKKLILSLLIFIMFTGCVSKPVHQKEVATTVSEETVTETEKSDSDEKTASDMPEKQWVIYLLYQNKEVLI